jgi:hypothetical protein
MANNSISLVNLDFDTLKANLKTYLKAQSQFKDYDFDGSNISVLLDILTYNTHMNAFYLNMAISETFLDSAQLRNSVVSKAKELNYTPRSAKSSEAFITTTFPQSNLSVFTIPAATKFTGKSGNGTFTFTTDQSYVLYPSNSVFTANISIYDGTYNSDAFVVDTSIEAQRFVLKNEKIDVDSLTVTVSDNNGQNNTVFNRAENLYGLNSNSAVYFIQAAENYSYEIVFGDGIFGRKPLNNSLIQASYRICNGSAADGSTNFTLDDNLGTVNGLGSFINATINVINYASGGADSETIESIRFNAPRHYQTQSRAITTNDYKNLILNNFTTVKAVNVFGGESSVDLVQYGKVFITPVTYSGAPLSDVDKQNIEIFLQDKSAVSIKPIVIDPDYLYILLDVKVKYDASETVKTAADIKSLVNEAIIAYDTEQLTDFDIEFNSSRLEAYINGADSSILSNQTSFIMKKIYNPKLEEPSYIDILYRNSIVPGSIMSTKFLSGSKIYQYTDFNDKNNTITTKQVAGKIVLSNDTNIIYLKDVTTPGYESYVDGGTIDYKTGRLSLNKIIVNGFIDSSSIDFFATSTDSDIKVTGNDLIQIELEKTNIEVLAQ